MVRTGSGDVYEWIKQKFFPNKHSF
jgi:hypothetical protein